MMKERPGCDQYDADTRWCFSLLECFGTRHALGSCSPGNPVRRSPFKKIRITHALSRRVPFSAMSLSVYRCFRRRLSLSLCLSLGVSLFPQTSLSLGLSLTPRNVSVWLAEQKRVQHTDYIQRWSLTRMLLFTECFETLPARLWLSEITSHGECLSRKAFARI